MSEAYDRGVTLFELRRYELAEAELRRHLTGLPRDSDALGLLAFCRMNQGDLEGGFALARAAVEAAPDRPYPNYVLSFLHERRGEFKEGESAILEAIHLWPNNPKYFAIACRLQQRQQKWAQCLHFADQGLAIDAVNADCLEYRLIALWWLERRDDFDQTADVALVAHPDKAFSHYHQGWRCVRERRWDAAETFFLETLRLEHDFADARIGLYKSVRTGSLVYRWTLGAARVVGQNANSDSDPVSVAFSFCIPLLAATGLASSLKGMGEIAVGAAAALLWFVLPLKESFPLSKTVYHLVLSIHPSGKLALHEDELRRARRLPRQLLAYFSGLIVVLAINGFGIACYGDCFRSPFNVSVMASILVAIYCYPPTPDELGQSSVDR